MPEKSVQMTNLTTSNFFSFLANSNKPVLVDFWAPGCEPCRILSGVLSEIARTYSDKVILAKVNVNQNPSLAVKYKISGIPYVIGFKNGKQIYKSVGVYPKKHWIETIKNQF